MSVKRLRDVTLHVSNDDDITECREALFRTVAIMMHGHHGFVVDARPCKTDPGCVTVIMKHTGPPTCNCKIEPRFEDAEEYGN